MSTPFTDRHIGTDAGAQAQMLAALGYETVAELVERAVPASILREPGVASDDGTAEPAAGTAAQETTTTSEAQNRQQAQDQLPAAQDSYEQALAAFCHPKALAELRAETGWPIAPGTVMEW